MSHGRKIAVIGLGYVGLPLAVESLRAKRGGEAAGEIVTLSAADPLNMIGILVPGERVPANSGTLITLRDGLPILEPSRTPAVVRYH